MSRQPTHRRTTRSLALVVAVAALAGTVGAGQALAAIAPPDERVLERQGRITLPPQLSSEDKAAVGPAGAPRPFIRPEPTVGPGPGLGDQQVATIPARTEPAGGRGGLAVVVVVAALLAAVGAATTWRVRHRRPQPESTA
jgi:hypothetical protein